MKENTSVQQAGMILTGAYDWRLVGLSYVIAVMASFTALDLAGRVTAARGRARLVWLLGGAFAMGVGIWSMHFTGMLAFSLPIALTYDVPTVLISLIVAMIASGFALFVASRPQLTLPQLVVSGLPMGVGIATMHYTGMAALRMQAIINYDPPLFALSILIAVVASIAALWLAFQLRSERVSPELWLGLKIGSALVMGVAITGMHYTGMLAAHFMPDAAAEPTAGIDPLLIGAAIGVATVVILGLALVSSLVDQRFEAEGNKRRRLLEQAVGEYLGFAQLVANGDLSERINVRYDGALGQLGQGLNSMAESLGLAKTEAQRLQQAETASRERLERAVSEYLAFVQQVAQGDLSQCLTPRYDGALGQLGEGLSSMVASLRDITGQVQEGTNAIAAAVAQISAATTEQAASSPQQSAAITETATAIEQVKVIAVQTADQATAVAHNSQSALEVARRSDQTVSETVSSMGQIRAQVASIARTIHSLSDQTRSISTIITSVSELADQINNLALNAAIETTRSGEQDRDIATLARLVRDLGQQAKEATRQVRQILSEIQTSTRSAVEVTDEGSRRVEAGVRLVTETGQMIHEIAAEVESGAQANVQMAAAAQQQTLGMQQIAQAMTAIQQAMTQTLLGTRQAEQAAQGLLSLAQSLQQSITVYRL
jgi:NO-binding membrane sensor protein with MHYT domain